MESYSSARIFVVDDEHVIASTMAAILQMAGYPAKCFTSPLDALKEVRHGHPSILISDVMMPHMNGIDLAIRVTALNPSCKILLISGQATTDDLLIEARLQGYDFRLVSKPIHPKDMLLEIERLAKSEAVA